jgi:hypothetical protein
MKVAAWRLRHHEALRQLLDLPYVLMFARHNVPAKSSVSNNVILEVFRKLQHSPATNSTVPAAGPHALRLSTCILRAQAPRRADCSAGHGLGAAKIIKEMSFAPLKCCAE